MWSRWLETCVSARRRGALLALLRFAPWASGTRRRTEWGSAFGHRHDHAFCSTRANPPARDALQQLLTRAPDDERPIGGMKVIDEVDGFAARPSDTRGIDNIDVASFCGEERLRRVAQAAQKFVARVLATATQKGASR